MICNVPVCQDEKETALHLLGRCNALSTTRFILLGLYHMDYSDLGQYLMDNIKVIIIRWPLLLKIAKL